MIRTLEAVVDEQGTVRLLEAVTLPQEHRALVMIKVTIACGDPLTDQGHVLPWDPLRWSESDDFRPKRCTTSVS